GAERFGGVTEIIIGRDPGPITVGSTVLVSGCADSSFNGEFTVLSIVLHPFTFLPEGVRFAQAAPDANSGGGTLSLVLDTTDLLIAGAGTNLYNVLTQAKIDSNYSNRPLSFVPYRMLASSSPFLLIGDSQQM